MYSVSDETRKPIFEGVQGENESRKIQFDISSWIEELGEGVCTATAKRPTDTTPYPVTVTRSGNVVTWKPNSVDTAIEGIGAFQLEYSINDSIAKTRIWNTKIAPSLDPAGDPPDPYDNWLAEMREIAADAIQAAQDAADEVENAQDEVKNAEAWAVGQRGGVDVPSTDPTYDNNSKYWAEQSLANQYGAYIVKSASGDIASFTDGADNVPMKSLNVTITPKQSGSGDPSPDNVRPITGWTNINVNDSPYAINNKVNITGKNIYNAPNNLLDTLVPCHIAVGTKVVISCAVTSNCGIRLYNSAKQFIDNWTMTGAQGDRYYRAFTAASSIGDIEYVSFYGANTVKDLMIETGVTTPSPYSPYGTTTTVPLGQTVYGGELDVVSGVLAIDRAIMSGKVIGTPSESVGYSNIAYGFVRKADDSVNKGNTRVDGTICNMYTVSVGAEWDSATHENEMLTGATYGAYWFGFPHGTTLAQMQTATENNVICYKLETPITVQLTPAEVRTLLGTNNVWADTGNTEVEYRADPTLAYNELANVIVSLGGNI